MDDLDELERLRIPPALYVGSDVSAKAAKRVGQGAGRASTPVVEALCLAIVAVVFCVPSCLMKILCGVD
jgi:hypothetical protein